MDNRIIIANWMMNGSAEMVVNIVPAIAGFSAPGVRSVLCPPAIILKLVAETIGSGEVVLGGQNCSTEKPFDNEFWDKKEEGIYVDIIDGTPLFCAKHKSINSFK